MSRLAQRVRQLEQRLGSCPDCRRPTIELRYQGAREQHTELEELCATCHEPVERIQVLLAFDPSDSGGQQ